MTQSVIVSTHAPSLTRPPPLSEWPPVMVSPDKLTVPQLRVNTRQALLPLTDSRFAPGPWIVSVPEGLLTTSGPLVRVIVREEVPNTDGSNLMVASKALLVAW